MQLPLSLSRDHVRAVLHRSLDLVLPARCLACGNEMRENGEVCSLCWSRLRFLSDPCCERCGWPFDERKILDASCPACHEHDWEFDRLRSAMRYDDFSRGMILSMKHRERLEGADVFAQWMVKAGPDLIARADLIIPMPLHRWRLVRRGFNQAGIIAQRMSQQTAIPVQHDLLRKNKASRSQVGLDGAARLANVTAANFYVPARAQPLLKGCRVLLIDDVFTTGATTQACSTVLKHAGAKGIDVLTLARVVNSPTTTI